CTSRNSDGNCNNSIHNETECSTHLSNKLDTTSFVVSGAASLAETLDTGSNISAPLDAAAVLAAVADLPGVSAEEKDTLALALEQSEDPAGLLVPMLEGWPRERQIAFLRHIEGLPLGKAEAAVSLELLPGQGLDAAGRREAAGALLQGLRAALGDDEYAGADSPSPGPAAEQAGGCLVAPAAAPSAGLWLLFAMLALGLVGLRRRRSR
ncbi:MAG TPA: MYXO-CTERM sorting domain-containing protein, partial [Haliangium sp.]|nr:MYXO-CTERM sorting domain-containing protein [Haliangium sp.]